MIVLFWIACIVLSAYVAGRKGYDKVWSIIFSLFFGILALAVYLCLEPKKHVKAQRLKEEEKLRIQAKKKAEAEIAEDERIRMRVRGTHNAQDK